MSSLYLLNCNLAQAAWKFGYIPHVGEAAGHEVVERQLREGRGTDISIGLAVRASLLIFVVVMMAPGEGGD